MDDTWIGAARAVPVASLLAPLGLNVGQGNPPAFGPWPTCGFEHLATALIKEASALGFTHPDLNQTAA